MVHEYLKDWKLAGFWPYTPIQGNSMETGVVLSGVTGVMDATVPGSVHADLIRAGVIEDPYFEMNSLKCEWVSNRWWIYSRKVDIPSDLLGGRVFLVFKGIDYKARIYFNGKHLCSHEGMNTVCRVDITQHVKTDGDNFLQVIIEHAPDEMGQIGYTSQTFTQKARFGYKWDFGTRLVNLGLYDDVYVDYDRGVRISEKHITTKGNSMTAKVMLDSALEGKVKLSATLSFKGEKVGEAECEVDAVPGENSAEVKIKLKNARKWYPNGYGRQPLYDLSLSVSKDNTVSDTDECQVGFRKLEYLRCEGAGEDALPYVVKINGKRIYIKGANITPLDHMYGCVDEKRYDKLLRLARDAGVTLIRVWGGGIIEKESFYRLCDKYGIMVWQEFIQSSSGIDNVPSKRPEFLKLLAATANQAVKDKRNHVSTTFWSGGNELIQPNWVPCDFGDENLAMLKEICNRLDPDRVMLPTSSSGPNFSINLEKKGTNHDVHGPWKYEGVERHYHLYNNSDSMLHSEFGNDGMSNLSSIKTVLSKKNMVVTTVAENLTWRHHGEWWDTYAYRDKNLFGEISDFEDYIKISQYMQAEGLRYALEANRRRVWQNCGSIVWQLNEPWPNVSCTCMVDYYMKPKLAYYFFRDAMRARNVSLRYDKLAYATGEEFKATLFVHNDLDEVSYKVKCTLLDENRRELSNVSYEGTAGAESCVEAGGVTLTVPSGKVFYADCVLEVEGKEVRSLYMLFVTQDGKLCQKSAIHYFDTYK
ncbi:MAG: glycoside hydrolase family 2 protein [Eubacteriales bacterium]